MGVKKPIILLVIAISILFGELYGQDIHFTQYNKSPLTLNPALTGNFSGTIRAGGIYRNQWNSISPHYFQTGLVYGEYKFPFRSDYLNAGIVVTGDQSGPAALSKQMFQFSGAYQKQLGAHQLMGGLQIGFISRSISDATYPAQYNNQIGDFDPQLPNKENNLGTQSSNLDLNGGLAYSYATKGFSFLIGQSIYHSNNPDIALVEDITWRLEPRYVTHARANIALSNNFGLLPSIVYKRHKEATEFMIGSLVRIGPVDKKLRFRVGSYYRNNIRGYKSSDLGQNVDAFSLNLGMVFKPFDLGLAYDFNVSDLRQASNYRGGFELALTYTYDFQLQPAKKTVPCYRY